MVFSDAEEPHSRCLDEWDRENRNSPSDLSVVSVETGDRSQPEAQETSGCSPKGRRNSGVRPLTPVPFGGSAQPGASGTAD
jgi:hypothetical protein